MFTLGASTRIWLATGTTDLRRGFNGLHALIVHQFGRDALAGDPFSVNRFEELWERVPVFRNLET